jgi:PilZ domain
MEGGRFMTMELMNTDEERRRHRRVFSLIPEEDVVLFSTNGRNHFVAKLLDLSRGGALIYSADPSVTAENRGYYKLYFQSRGAMFHLEGLLVRREFQFFAFQFVNVTPLDLAEIRGKLARMEILAARMCVGN